MKQPIVLNVTPVGKPRMTQRDKWMKRPAVVQYWKFKDELNRAAKATGWIPWPTLHLIFYLPMPQSWSTKKKEQMRFKPHQQKPDLSNLLKAYEDALYEEDCTIYQVSMAKYWADEGRIDVYA